MFFMLPSAHNAQAEHREFLSVPTAEQLRARAAQFKQSVLSYRFRSLNYEQFNKVGGISAILRDSQGFLWFGGTAGLARFDGYELKLYRHDPFDLTSISDNNVMALAMDAHNNSIKI